jgi:hypothetical protein
MMRDELKLIVADKTENHARILVRGTGKALTGTIRGPFSDFAKTLTADFNLRPTDKGLAEALITEPCYWTPHLPMWYELHVEAESGEQVLPIGLKRFYSTGCNFILESKRIVLRGKVCESPTENDLMLARQHETALIVTEPPDAVCKMASRLGVPLLVGIQAETEVDRFTWFPAVYMVMDTSDKLSQLKKTSQIPVAEIIKPTGHEPTTNCQAVIIELGLTERPPAWVATCDKPVIVIRKDPDAEIKTARASCDRLQAELAPEFDLAGYFV